MTVGRRDVLIELGGGHKLLRDFRKEWERQKLTYEDLAHRVGAVGSELAARMAGLRPWTVEELIAVGEELHIDNWQIAAELGLIQRRARSLVDDAVNKVVKVSLPGGIQDYLRTDFGNRVTTVFQILDEKFDMDAKRDIKRVERGKDFRMPYHTYVRVPLAGAAPLETMTVADRNEQKLAIEQVLRKSVAYCHWETSVGLLKDVGWEHDFVLIIEDEFANQGIDPVRLRLKENRKLPDIGPVIVAGVYYSGAKDIAVLIHNETGLGALDVSRYVAELLVDFRAMRKDPVVQEMAFASAMASDVSNKLVITVDDSAALARSVRALNKGWSKTTTGTAVILQVTDKLLDYAAFHIARTTVEEQTAFEGQRRPPTAPEIAVARNHLSDIQEQLLALIPVAFPDPIIQEVDLAPKVTAEDEGFPDRTDLMFDQYVMASQEVVKKLHERVK